MRDCIGDATQQGVGDHGGQHGFVGIVGIEFGDEAHGEKEFDGDDDGVK